MEEQRGEFSPCRQPPALDDLDLIAAVDDEADAAVQAHLQICPACAARARAFAELQQQLRARLFRTFCPTSEELAAFQQGMLEGGQRLVIARHVAECPYCTRELQLVSAVLTPLQTPRR